MISRLQEKYKKEIVSELKSAFGYKNNLMVPKITKVVINSGFGSKTKETKFAEIIENTLTKISGQKPVATLAKKSISNFKLRQGTVVGLKATLRGKRMYEFVDKLINVALPRVRDFRGLKTSVVDGNGNLNIGFKEHLAFPEISSDEIDRIHGLEVTVVSTAKNKKEGYKLFQLFGFPFNEMLNKEKKAKKKKIIKVIKEVKKV